MSTEATVHALPPCDFCAADHRSRKAEYDGATKMGPWAFMCPAHFEEYGLGLGTGVGQRLVVAP